jgi:hypothetical protein
VVLLLAGILYGPDADRVDGLVEAILDDLFEEPSLVDQQPELADQARCAGLLGAIRRDLSPYGYVPSDARYELMKNVMAIFDPQGSRAVPVQTRVAAAEALGQARDPRPGVGLRSWLGMERTVRARKARPLTRDGISLIIRWSA